MFPIQERKEVMDYTELKKLMSEQKVEMTEVTSEVIRRRKEEFGLDSFNV